jgi:citrate lyase subunit beta/citryl-CoA lyase
MRCLLFVPADSEKKLAKAADLDVDALILDLEDAVAADRREFARGLAREFLKDHDNVWVRINPIDSDDAESDLDAVVPAGPQGIVLPKARSADDVTALADRLDALEDGAGIDGGSTQILSLCTERVEALFTLGDYRNASSRLVALSWGAEDLSAELGASATRDTSGQWLPPFQFARTLCLFAAHAAEVAPIDTVFTDFRNEPGLARAAEEAARDGFTGMLAIHPAQVDVIQAAFTPSAADVSEARRIVELFDENPGAGALSMDGRMLDRPHYLKAQRILARAHRKS